MGLCIKMEITSPLITQGSKWKAAKMKRNGEISKINPTSMKKDNFITLKTMKRDIK
jgi:hypothetical protein